MPAAVPSGLAADPATAPTGPLDRAARAGLRAFGVDTEHASLFALIATGEPISYAIMFVLFESAAVAMALAIWSVVAELVPGMDARQVGAPLLVASLLGEALGSFVGAPIAARVGIENLLTLATLV